MPFYITPSPDCVNGCEGKLEINEAKQIYCLRRMSACKERGINRKIMPQPEILEWVKYVVI
jgi:hypothetical protein